MNPHTIDGQPQREAYNKQTIQSYFKAAVFFPNIMRLFQPFNLS